MLTSAEDWRSRAYVLNTRPVLNFLGVDRLDILTTVLGPRAYVPPTVLAEVRSHVRWVSRALQRRVRHEPEAVEAAAVGYVESLARWESRLALPTVRRMVELELVELETAASYQAAGALDAGESEVLAVARHRSWVVVIDELAGHRLAEDEGLASESTLTILLRAVATSELDLELAEAVWRRIRLW